MLTQKSLKLLITNDAESTRAFNNVRDAINPVLQTPILDGVLVKNLTIPTGGKLVVSHGLGRAPNGWFIVAASNAISVPYALASDQKAPDGGLTLTFSTGAGAIVSVWVF